MDVRCQFCGALHWMAEHLQKLSNTNPKFGTCCNSGKFNLPTMQHVPPELYDLLTHQDPIGKSFCKHIRNYNGALAMTSVG